MSQSKGKRGGSTDNGTSGGVLRTVARAHELVVGRRPRDDATQVSAHWKAETRMRQQINVTKIRTPSESPPPLTSVETIGFQGLVLLDNEVTAV